MKRKLVNLLSSLVILGAAGGSWYILHRSPCEAPIEYTVGSFDTRFKVSKDDFVADLAQAEAIWDTALGKNLFAYDATAGMPVNLIYDSRQATADKNTTLLSAVGDTEASAETIKLRFSALKDDYEQSQADYNAMLARYEQDRQSYDTAVANWNARGGAPAPVYASLTQQKNDLTREQASVESKRLSVNALAEEVNALVKKYNYLVSMANDNITEINKAADKEFEQGEYVRDAAGERINIYEYSGKDELVRVLAHEMGHALGLDHNDDPESIMYYLNKGSTLALSSSDMSDLKKVCGVK